MNKLFDGCMYDAPNLDVRIVSVEEGFASSFGSEIQGLDEADPWEW